MKPIHCPSRNLSFPLRVACCVLPASVKNIPPGPSVGRKVAERRAGMADSAGEPSAE